MADKPHLEVIRIFERWEEDLAEESVKLTQLRLAIEELPPSQQVAAIFSRMPSLYAFFKVREEQFKDICVQSGALVRTESWEVTL